MILTFVEIKDAIIMALTALRSNKLRSGLTILGVMVGVSSVIGMAAIIDGLNGAMDQEIDQLGSNIIMVSRFKSNVDWDELTPEQRNRPQIEEGEALAIKENCPLIDGVAPQNHYYVNGGNEAKFKNRKYVSPQVIGSWPDYIKVNNKEISEGRFITNLDNQIRLMVCVIGADVRETLFPYGEDAVGQQIRVNGSRFEVIGVMEKVKSNFENSEVNQMVLMPLETSKKLYPWDEALTLFVKPRSMAVMDQAMDEVIAALRIHRKLLFNQENNFALETQQQIKDMIGNITQYIYMAMIVITSVGLMVGGIGVMNIMLVSVTERTREIGIRKAIGAKRTNIIIQFLTEAMTLSGAGGVIGVLIGVSLGVLVNGIIGWPITVSVLWITIGFLVSVSVGLASGVYPAMKASRLDPIEALRYE
ncbi:MAG: hypothetical protein DWP97_07640 [Calditrichaeota bacterium]|nr:MAG: hypothetical protein DWP97_07640 [Calditrichota bacterium]